MSIPTNGKKRAGEGTDGGGCAGAEVVALSMEAESAGGAERSDTISESWLVEVMLPADQSIDGLKR